MVGGQAPFDELTLLSPKEEQSLFREPEPPVLRRARTRGLLLLHACPTSRLPAHGKASPVQARQQKVTPTAANTDHQRFDPDSGGSGCVGETEVQQRCNRGATEVQQRCNRGATEVQQKCNSCATVVQQCRNSGATAVQHGATVVQQR